MWRELGELIGCFLVQLIPAFSALSCLEHNGCLWGGRGWEQWNGMDRYWGCRFAFPGKQILRQRFSVNSFFGRWSQGMLGRVWWSELGKRRNQNPLWSQLLQRQLELIPMGTAKIRCWTCLRVNSTQRKGNWGNYSKVWLSTFTEP